MKQIRMLMAVLYCLVCLQPVGAQQKEKPEKVSTANCLGVYWFAGYDNLFMNDSKFRNIGGPMGGMGFAYQLQHGTYSRGAFLFQLGLEAQYGLNFRNGSFGLTRRLTSPSDDLFMGYQFRNLKEKQSGLDASASLMFGGKFKGFFFLAGAKLGYPIMANYTTQSDVDRVIYDAQAIDDYTGMPNHLLSSEQVAGSGSLAYKLNPQAAFEIGYDFHKPVPQKKNKNRNKKQKQKWTFKEYGHCQLSAFVNVGVLDYKPTPMMPLVEFGSAEGVSAIHSTANAQEFAAVRTIPIYAGLKFAIMCELPGKKKQPDRNPYIVTFVRDEATGKPIAGATVTTQAMQQGKAKKKPVVKTTDSKYGRVVKSYVPGEYAISATHDGYFSKKPFKFTHEDQDDTVRIALYPKRSLQSQVVDAKSGRLVTAEVTILNEAGKTVAKTTLDSAAQMLTALVDDRKHYTICASAQGYRDTCVTVANVSEVQTIQLEPIRVKRFVLKNMFFATDKTTILPSSEPALRELYEFLRDNPEVRIRIIGHTDDVGKDDYNQRLSEGRAKSVKQEMVKRGIDSKRMVTTGHGETDPIVPNDSEEHRQMNRRVEIVILNNAR